MSIRLFAINAYLAFEGIFRRCPGNSRCGLLGLSVNMHSGIRGSDSCQEVCVFFLDPTLQCGRCVNEFDITVQLVNIPTEDQILVENARQRWESIIVGDVADVSPSIGFRDLLPRTCNQPYRVDDVFVCVRNEYIEDFLATGRALVVRQRNDLPVVGEVVVDIDYIKSLNGTLDTFLEDAILQIMGYSLGFGSFIGSDDCPFRGPKSIAEFAALSGCLENNIDARFCSSTFSFFEEEECLGNELMTILELNSTNLLSRITVAKFEDIGYEVDYTNVDEYTSDNINATCRCTQQRELSTVHDTTPQSFVFEQRKPRQLSNERYRSAISYGKRKLAEAKEQYEITLAHHGGRDFTGNDDTDGQKFVGDQAITVLVIEEGEIHSIVVRA